MTKNRLEAMTDGTVAIILTLLVLDLKTPTEPTLKSLLADAGVFTAYLSSFVFIVIIWNAHHQLFHDARTISQPVIWLNFLWLFFLSLSPFVTSWVGEDLTALWPQLTYALVFAMWTISFALLARAVARCSAHVAHQRHGDRRSALSIAINCLILLLVPLYPPIALMGRFVVAALWVMPRRALMRLYLTAPRNEGEAPPLT